MNKMPKIGEPQDNVLHNISLKRDLQVADGALLSQFSMPDTAQPVLLYWVDCDLTFNRWLVSWPTDEALTRYLACELSLGELLCPISESIFLVDVNCAGELARTWRCLYKTLPAAYLPDEQVFFDATLLPQLSDRCLE